MASGPPDPQTDPLSPREPTVADLVDLCRNLHAAGARFIIVGGFALRAHGYARQTNDIDLLIDAGLDNETRVVAALSKLPDAAARDLEPGDVARHTVVRVADEIIVDLMERASGVAFAEAAPEVVHVDVDGVRLPVASPRLLLLMKRRAAREKDRGDIHFLEHLLRSRGESA